MKRTGLFTLIAAWLLLTGCSINHPVAKDYGNYLASQGGEYQLPSSELDASYEIDPETQAHSYGFRAASVGMAHLWVVEFGKILEQTLEADYVQTAFNGLSKNSGVEQGPVIDFTLESFEFKNYRAYTTMNISVKEGDNVVSSKSYSAQGHAKGGQMWAAGPFGMTKSTLNSVKNSIDKILEEFIKDNNSK